MTALSDIYMVFRTYKHISGHKSLPNLGAVRENSQKFTCMQANLIAENMPKVAISKEAYKALKAEKKEGESFSDVIVRKFQRGNPAAILDYLKESTPNPDLADAVEKASRELRKNFKTRRVEF